MSGRKRFVAARPGDVADERLTYELLRVVQRELRETAELLAKDIKPTLITLRDDFKHELVQVTRSLDVMGSRINALAVNFRDTKRELEARVADHEKRITALEKPARRGLRHRKDRS